MNVSTDQSAGGLADLQVPGWQIEHLPSVGSTNIEALARVAAGVAPGLVLVTDDQTAGRARFTRSWRTPPGSAVAMSAVVAPHGIAADQWGWLPLLTGVAVDTALNQLGVPTALKWPNDVLAAEQAPAPGKLCGILVSRATGPTGTDLAVIGIGINTAMTRDQLPVPTASSLALNGVGKGGVVSAAEVVTRVLTALAAELAAWAAGADPAARYRARSATIGARVRITLDAEDSGATGARRAAAGVVGTAVDVDRTGSLVVETEAGRQSFAAGDVTHLRLAGTDSPDSP
ncbi:biotin--[acetyl-CoA-carboxylase] ligase [Parenemella sanctibonifatiensis]|uniref:biotin--[biotin carboxyl-carrier protein] ligase n=1 Tax=Parenemella sanctibonifatiensis TaxID=2016505 RepID=A0A255EMI4_9ACTN|nr:biotin--[acetyl-CoA-carboxylase] ligase [Parenemella sanctibonifatiensis]OYN92191.1 biotin--[acetyl-CoA-carboxylase] ligase [Parenemella sanctibonifatiensis]